jgi:hypothetical protein
MPLSMNNTTLTFNDASTQTTSAVTAVNVGTGISSTGGKTPTLTNTGVTSIVAGTGISVSGATGAVTVSSTVTGGVTSLNGQTGAVVDTNLDGIGSYITAVRAVSAPGSGSARNSIGTTYAGSGLRYNYNNVVSGSDGDFTGFYQNPSNQSYNGGGTALSGTWRALGRDVIFIPESNQPIWKTGLYVRIS